MTACIPRSLFLIPHFVLALTTWLATPIVPEAFAQTARVQFINASPYPEADSVDVYRNGKLWLEGFRGPDATPFEDWPIGEIEISISEAGRGQNNAFLIDPITIEFGKKYIIAVGGDPLHRADQPPIELWVVDWAREVTFLEPFSITASMVSVIDGPDLEVHWRQRKDFFSFITARNYGDFSPYVVAPSVPFDIDYRIADGASGPSLYPTTLVEGQVRQMYGDSMGTVFGSFLFDNSERTRIAQMNVTYGFVDPPSPDHDPFASFSVLADGTIVPHLPIVAQVQLIHNAPYPEVSEVDIYINGFLVVDDLAFREATPFTDLPAGLVDDTSPTLQVEIVPADQSELAKPLFSDEIVLRFGQTFVGVIAGDPLGRDGQPPMDIYLSDQGGRSSVEPESTGLLFFHGTPDLLAVNIGIEGEPLPLVAALGYGAFSDFVFVRSESDTLYVMDAAGRQTLARFHAEIATRSLVDSSLTVLTSGFANPDESIGAQAELDLVAALPSGGPLLTFEKREPTPWWQQPLGILAGLVAVALVILVMLQTRVRRLKARASELKSLVDERTKELLLEKEKTEDQARRLAELDEAKNRFFANISHEFRTPLTLVLGPLQDAIDGSYGSVAPQLSRQFLLMRRNTRRLLRLVNQLLDLSKLESGKMELHRQPGDLISFLRELVRVFTPLAERRRVSLKMQSSAKGLPTSYDPDALEKVFANLISNAIKFTPEGGDVLVRVGVVPRPDPVVNPSIPMQPSEPVIPTKTAESDQPVIPTKTAESDQPVIPTKTAKSDQPVIPTSATKSSEEGSLTAFGMTDASGDEGSLSPLGFARDDNPLWMTAVVRVADTGAGIPEEHLERIFERFQQGDTSIRRSHEGSGIGLTLARELAELHGGTLVAESVVGEGSTFTVTLPIEILAEEPGPDLRPVETALMEEPLIAADDDALPAEVHTLGPDASLILIVEDNADVREYLRSHLASRHRLIEAEDGEAGLAAALEHKPDLILSDVMMPRMDGYEMCRLIKTNEALRHIPVIMLTAKAGEIDTVEGLESGADDYMAKPFSVNELQARVGNLLSSRRELREKFSREVIVKPGDIQITAEDEIFLDTLLDCVNRHLPDANFTVDWLADTVGLSRRQLERRVQAVTGQSPADLVRSLRLQRASQLLRAHAGTVAEIAYAVGFASPRHFSTAFSKQFGESPTMHASHAVETAQEG